MIICICRRVSDVDIARQAGLGKSFDQLRDELGVGAQCGRCACSARDIIDAHGPDAKPTTPVPQPPHGSPQIQAKTS